MSPSWYARSPSPPRGRSHASSLSRSREAAVCVKNPGNHLFVRGLSSRITTQELENHFSGEGEVLNVYPVLDRQTRKCRGFGFVKMATVEQADNCIKHLDGSWLGGRKIVVEKAKTLRGQEPITGRYVGRPMYHGMQQRPSPSYSSNAGRHRSPSYPPVRGGREMPFWRSRSPSPYLGTRLRRYWRRVSRSLSPTRHRCRPVHVYGR